METYVLSLFMNESKPIFILLLLVVVVVVELLLLQKWLLFLKYLMIVVCGLCTQVVVFTFYATQQFLYHTPPSWLWGRGTQNIDVTTRSVEARMTLMFRSPITSVPYMQIKFF
jgi:hypothetical protein